jgi:hypothetical protein
MQPNEGALVITHGDQLTIEKPTGNNCCDGRYESEQSSRTQYRIRLLGAFAALALMGMAGMTIGVYRLCHCQARWFDFMLEIGGGAIFMLGAASMIGIALVY